jgi:Uma2 family endonuclease
MAKKALDAYTYDEYLDIERASEEKFEYHDGMLVAMAGGTAKHGQIALNFGTELNIFFKAQKRSCSSLSSDVRVHIWTANKAYYPDVSVVCGPIEYSRKDKQAITNPILVLEVLSETTMNLDYGVKFLNYRLLPSLQQYVLVSQSEAKVDVYSRQETGWDLRTYEGLSAQLQLPHLDCSISLADIYRRVEGIDPEA